MRFFLLLLTAGSLAFGLLRSPVYAKDLTPAHCADWADIITDDIDVGTMTLESKPSTLELSMSRSSWQRDRRRVETSCAAGDPSALYVAALLRGWHAWLLHASDKEYASETELAVQQLTQCVSRYFGTRRGAVCATWQKKLIRWQIDWDRQSQ